MVNRGNPGHAAFADGAGFLERPRQFDEGQHRLLWRLQFRHKAPPGGIAGSEQARIRHSDHGIGLWYKLNMREIPISKFKATCLAVLEEVRRTGAPVRVTRFGRPVAEVVPTRPETVSSWLGCAKDSIEISGDITQPVGAFSRWTARK